MPPVDSSMANGSQRTDAQPPPPGAGGAWFWAMPNISVALFILAMVAFLVWAQRNDAEERRHTLIEDILWQEQTLRLHLQSNEEVLAALANDIGSAAAREDVLRARAEFVARTRPELAELAWIDARGSVAWGVPPAEGERAGLAAAEAFERSRRSGRPAYGAPQGQKDGPGRFTLYLPAFSGGRFTGALVGTYSMKRLLEEMVPWWYAQRYELKLIDLDGRVWASRLGVGDSDPGLVYQVPFDPPGHGLLLRAEAYRKPAGFAERGLVALVVGLSLVMVWSLWALRKHMNERGRAEQAFRRESSFRKAMEDSMVTGIRAVDMDGRITYVNPAFCRLVGMSEAELVGCRPPMPYWSPQQSDYSGREFAAMLRGHAPAAGVEHRFRRKSGEHVDVVIYSAPLIDAHGRQTGWMSSVHDITERKRAREALRASHERFVAVLDGLDAAVSVSELAGGEVLFANRGFREAFCPGPEDAPCRANAPWKPLAAVALEDAPEGSFDIEFHNESDQRWYHVRGHPLTWVDGRAARLEVATDITARKLGEEMSRQQLERLQFTSRLVSMGEMASSLAHELNQPLSAIASYATGCANMLTSGSYEREEVAGALHKISQQAQRAGRIVRSVREFVKKSEPRLEPCDINPLVEEAAGFAEIEARRRGVVVVLELAEPMPQAMADRTMIQQVVHNLVRNGVEAMAEVAPERRRLAVRTRSGAGGIVIEVADHGAGVPDDLGQRLFEPFFTTKAEGMGMGLNICRSIVEYHQGRLEFEANDGGGTVFRVHLPAQAEAAVPARVS